VADQATSQIAINHAQRDHQRQTSLIGRQ